MLHDMTWHDMSTKTSGCSFTHYWTFRTSRHKTCFHFITPSSTSHPPRITCSGHTRHHQSRRWGPCNSTKTWYESSVKTHKGPFRLKQGSFNRWHNFGFFFITPTNILWMPECSLLSLKEWCFSNTPPITPFVVVYQVRNQCQGLHHYYYYWNNPYRWSNVSSGVFLRKSTFLSRSLLVDSYCYYETRLETLHPIIIEHCRDGESLA